jgi:hypothetical protein
MRKSARGYIFRQFIIPEHMGEALDEYVDRGRPVGDFLYAVLTNDLFEACGRADMHNAPNLTAYCAWLYNEAPSQCYGSREKVVAWLKRHQEERDRRMAATGQVQDGSADEN